jgi:hypothetical protein
VEPGECGNESEFQSDVKILRWILWRYVCVMCTRQNLIRMCRLAQSFDNSAKTMDSSCLTDLLVVGI